jgi:hypothetical protein
MKNKRISVVLKIIVIYLLALFICSSSISYSDREKFHVKPKEVVSYALSFLDDDILKQKGYRLDCSGFTREVFGKFDIQLPASSSQQYESIAYVDEELKPADLVFFAINNTQINHVGLMVNDSTFIHSPGKNKFVRTENLNSPYWLKYYKSNRHLLKLKSNDEKY